MERHMRKALVLALAITAAPALAQESAPPLRETCPKLSATEITEIENDKTSYGELISYARAYCVSIAEAKRRMDIQMRDAVRAPTEPGPPPPPPPDSIGAIQTAMHTKETATFAGLWIEHQPNYRVVVAFTRGGAKTLAKYTRDPLFVPINRAGATWAQMRATQERLWKELEAVQARPTTASADEMKGRVEISLATDLAVVRKAEREGRIKIPSYVTLIEPPPFKFYVPPPLPQYTRLRAFPRAYYRRSGFSMGMEPTEGLPVIRSSGRTKLRWTSVRAVLSASLTA
jgi:hypothetical protein